MATMKDVPSTNWLSELEIEEYSIIHQYQVNSFVGIDELGEAHDTTIRQSFSFLSTDSSYDLIEKKPSKIPKTQHIPPRLPSFSPPPNSLPKNNLPSSRILSFENSGSNTNSYLNSIVSPREQEPSPSRSDLLEGDHQTITSTNQQGIKKPLPAPRPLTRSQTNAQDHIMAERKRREKLTQRFVALSAMLPGLKKMDKASVLGDAICHIKNLQERVKEFEEQRNEKTVESVVLVKKSQLCLDDQFSSSEENSSGGDSSGSSSTSLPEIEIRVLGKDVLIKIVCEKRKSCLTNILVEIEKLGLSIVNSSVLPFGATLDITVIAQKEDEFDMTHVEIAKNLRLALSKFM